MGSQHGRGLDVGSVALQCIRNFFPDVKVFIVKMAKPAMIAYISQVNCAILDLLPCRLFIYNCSKNLEQTCFNFIQCG